MYVYSEKSAKFTASKTYPPTTVGKLRAIVDPGWEPVRTASLCCVYQGLFWECWNTSDLRMHCIDTEALVFMFNGGSPYNFTIHSIFTRLCIYFFFNLYKQWNVPASLLSGTLGVSMQYILNSARPHGQKWWLVPTWRLYPKRYHAYS